LSPRICPTGPFTLERRRHAKADDMVHQGYVSLMVQPDESVKMEKERRA
jgi:hypothetical protein